MSCGFLCQYCSICLCAWLTIVVGVFILLVRFFKRSFRLKTIRIYFWKKLLQCKPKGPLYLGWLIRTRYLTMIWLIYDFFFEIDYFIHHSMGTRPPKLSGFPFGLIYDFVSRPAVGWQLGGRAAARRTAGGGPADGGMRPGGRRGQRRAAARR